MALNKLTEAEDALLPDMHSAQVGGVGFGGWVWEAGVCMASRHSPQLPALA